MQIQISWLLKKPTDLDLHCLLLSMWISISSLDQVIWLADNKKWAWHLNLFSMRTVNEKKGVLIIFVIQNHRSNQLLYTPEIDPYKLLAYRQILEHWCIDLFTCKGTNKIFFKSTWYRLKKRSASVAQLDAPSDWRPGGRGFNPRRGRQHSFVEIGHEIFSTVILFLPPIQEGQLSVSGERICTILVNRLED